VVAFDALLRNLGVVSGSGQRLALSLPLDRFSGTAAVSNEQGASGNTYISENNFEMGHLTASAALAAAIISAIVRVLAQASGSSDPSVIRINVSTFFPNSTVPPFFPPFVDLPVPVAQLVSSLGPFIQESMASLLQGSFAVEVDVLCVLLLLLALFVTFI
jgi:hypothetical protein